MRGGTVRYIACTPDLGRRILERYKCASADVLARKRRIMLTVLQRPGMSWEGVWELADVLGAERRPLPRRDGCLLLVDGRPVAVAEPAPHRKGLYYVRDVLADGSVWPPD